MTNTPNLALPYLATAQAQKHITVNEALSLLDTLAQMPAVRYYVRVRVHQPVFGNRKLVGQMIVQNFDEGWIGR